MTTPTNNHEFLQAVFAGLEEPLRPFVLGFSGAPKDRKAWGGDPWRDGKTNTDSKALNWYYTTAVYAPGDEGYKRQEKGCSAIWGVMLDDIGSKALPVERLADCPPSILIETSPDNYQATFLFDEPQTGLERVKALNQALVEANLCDPGAKSPPTRWGRLPFASNQ